MSKKQNSTPVTVLRDILLIPKGENRVLPLIRALAADSAKVFFVHHAEQRMIERQITRPQVMECLLHGTVVEPPHQDVHGRWRCSLTHCSLGEQIQVVVSPEESRLLVFVITVF